MLGSVIRHRGTIKRTVFTSDFKTMLKEEKGPSNGKYYTEAGFQLASASYVGGLCIKNKLVEASGSLEQQSHRFIHIGNALKIDICICSWVYWDHPLL